MRGHGDRLGLPILRVLDAAPVRAMAAALITIPVMVGDLGEIVDRLCPQRNRLPT